jgi:hypothetical protein
MALSVLVLSARCGMWPKKAALVLGADRRFFALLGSAPQELNTARPEAKLKC